MKNFFYFILIVLLCVVGFFGWKTYNNVHEKLDRFEELDSIATALQKQDSLRLACMDSVTYPGANTIVINDTAFTAPNGHAYLIIKSQLVNDPDCPKCQENLNAKMRTLFDEHLVKEKELIEAAMNHK